MIHPNPYFRLLQQQIPLASAIQRVFIMAHNKSIKGRWIDGQLYRHLITSRMREVNIVTAKLPQFADKDGSEKVAAMVRMADLTRKGFMSGDLSTVMSPRTVITWAENTGIFGDMTLAFRLSFLNKCDEIEDLQLRNTTSVALGLIYQKHQFQSNAG